MVDRVMRQSIAQKLAPIYENIFSYSSFGFKQNRVMTSFTSWLERKLFLMVSTIKIRIIRPTNSKFLGFTFWKNKDTWKSKPEEY